MSHAITDLADAQPGEQTNEPVTGETLTAALETVIERLAPGWLAQRADLRNRLLEALDAGPDQVLRLMSYEEFLDWAIQNDIRRAEWVDGKVFLMTTPSTRHQLLSMFLGSLLNFYVMARDLGVVAGPLQMRLTQPPRGREPDLLFIAKAHLDRLQKRYLDGPADLVVEIVSPDSGRRDREEKFAE
ncbi:MAG TPA: Uma2 family endonuclease, partial [Caldilineaceae bacterium]|nr:Uma2 family endonuclease [Caldilineaceae bacterium]